jgi:hypothetical protein
MNRYCPQIPEYTVKAVCNKSDVPAGIGDIRHETKTKKTVHHVSFPFWAMIIKFAGAFFMGNTASKTSDSTLITKTTGVNTSSFTFENSTQEVKMSYLFFVISNKFRLKPTLEKK